MISNSHLDVIVIPKTKITQLSKAKDEHAPLLGHLLLVANKVAEITGIINSGFRIVINDGKQGCKSLTRSKLILGQSVYHL